MAQYGAVGAGTRIFLLLLLVLVLAAGGLLWFDFLGLVDANRVLSPLLRLVRIQRPAAIEDPDDPFLLESERLKAREEALDLRAAALDEREKGLAAREAEVEEVAQSLQEQRRSLEEQQKSINERLKTYEDREANIRDIATKLVGMKPENAVALLLEMKDVEIIDIVRMTDAIAEQEGTSSITPKWLADMPAERSAAISQKLMLGRP
jgi:flagellar protein FlbB